MQDETITVIDDFLSAQECRQIISLARPFLEASTVWDVENGVRKQDGHRVSEQVFFAPAQNTLIRTIENKIATIVGLSLDYGEMIQAVHYDVGGYYKEHWDYFDPAFEGNASVLAKGGQRTATFMVYLNDVAEGGATFFPRISFRGIPKQGRALLWQNINRDGSLNTDTLHFAEPILQGEKWIFTKWFREKKITEYPD